MARERTFHHTHADKLDDPERHAWLPPDEVVRRLELRPGLRVADIGAGSGYLTAPIAEAVGPTGRVAALDLQPEMLERLRHRLAPGAPVDRVQADASATTLPTSSQDLALIANVWHELDDRTAALAEMTRIVRSDGRLAILDWRMDVAQPPGPPLEHRVSLREVVEELRGAGWSVQREGALGMYSYLVIASAPPVGPA
jgi:ubiquinone/menaquinone biosynthesis C-methylase UbiE